MDKTGMGSLPGDGGRANGVGAPHDTEVVKSLEPRELEAMLRETVINMERLSETVERMVRRAKDQMIRAGIPIDS
jgi:hypothetical protein